MRTGFASLIAAVLGITALYLGTEGFQIATAEGLRRLAVEQSPQPVPDVALQDQKGKAFRLSDLQGEVVLVEFIYTTCPSLCQVMGESFAKLQSALVASRGLGKLQLVSISFDLENDSVEQLKDYAERHSADYKLWKIARPATPIDLQLLLTGFGIKIIPDPFLGFQHNAAIHVVSRAGELRRIINVSVEEALAAAREMRQ